MDGIAFSGITPEKMEQLTLLKMKNCRECNETNVSSFINSFFN